MHLSVEPGVVFGLIAIVAGITIYAFIKSRHNERMLQIEMGNAIEEIQNTYFGLKFGLLLIGMGAGFLTAFLCNELFSINAFELYPAFIFMFGGIGLLVSFFMVQRYKKKG